MAEMKDGGPAFPYVSPLNKTYEDGSRLFPETPGMSMRDYFAGKAPAEEIDGIGGSTAAECAVYLGIEKYEFSKHYLMIVAKARYQWADAMLAERAK